MIMESITRVNLCKVIPGHAVRRIFVADRYTFETDKYEQRTSQRNLNIGKMTKNDKNP